MWINWNLHRMTSIVTLKNSLTAPQKVNQSYHMTQFLYTSKRNEKYVHIKVVHIHSNIIHKSPKWKQLKCPSTKKLIKCLYPCNGKLFSHRKE